MNLTFNTGVPAAANNPSNDQAPMLVNNASNAAIWNVDHYGFGNNLGGWHNVVHIPQIIGNVDPAPTIAPANAGQIYTKTVSGDLQLFYESSGGIVNQLTPNTPTITPVISGTGATYLPGGLVMNWGGGVIPSGVTTFTFAHAFGFPSKIFSIVITGQTNSSPTNNVFVVQSSIAGGLGATFQVNNFSASVTAMNYIALGIL